MSIVRNLSTFYAHSIPMPDKIITFSWRVDEPETVVAIVYEVEQTSNNKSITPRC